MPLDDVEQFEQRCDIGISAGRWWRDNNGNLGRVDRDFHLRFRHRVRSSVAAVPVAANLAQVAY
jgi:hypothetical protein